MKSLVASFLADPATPATPVAPTGCGLRRIHGPLQFPFDPSQACPYPRRGFRLPTPDPADKNPPPPLDLLLEGYVNIQADGVIIDHELGSIGLLHFLVLPGPGEDQPASPAAAALLAQITKRLEDAAHLRHLLGLKRLDKPAPMRVQLPAIEIVFLAPDLGSSSASLKDALRQSLHTTLQDSGLLHSISVNLAFLGATPATRQADLGALRRAFCWLLTHTRSWFADLAASHDHAPKTAPIAWDRLELTDFRRAGVRVWKKSPDARLHLIHGPNGSGKSTLAEGFAFAVTGDSPRLSPTGPDPASPDRLTPLIYARAASPVAHARILHGETPRETRRVPPAPVTESSEAPLPRPLPPSALLLDQSLCDKLAARTSAERAREWLKTFFVDLDTARIARRDLRQNLLQQLGLLAPGPDNAAQLDTLVGLAAGIYQGDGQPVALSDFLRLISLVPLADFASASVRMEPSPGLALPELLGQTIPRPAPATPLDQIPWATAERTELVKRLLSAFEADVRLLETWRPHATDTLKNLLVRLGSDTFETSDAPPALDEADRARRFNRWLHLVARADLLERARVIAATRDSLVASTPDAPPGSDLEDIAPRLPAPDIDRLLVETKRERDSARAELASLSTLRTDTIAARHSRQVESRELPPLLDAIRAGFFLPRLQSADADRLQENVRLRRSESLADLRIGTPGWTEPLLDILAARKHAATAFEGPLFAPESDARHAIAKFAGRAEALVSLVENTVRLARLDADATRKFFQQLETGPLRDAIDEFTAFLTPARWAYDPIKTDLRLTGTSTGSDQESLGFSSHGQDVSKVLNTAQLNTLALALYLLCAPRVPNPWRTVFLDDPLQNMDELTVATVSRVLSRLHRLWQDPSLSLTDWEIVLLLHREEDCERILMECPAAHYRLPWLTPHSANQTTTPKPESIHAEPASSTVGGGADDKLMPLNGFLAEG